MQCDRERDSLKKGVQTRDLRAFTSDFRNGGDWLGQGGVAHAGRMTRRRVSVNDLGHQTADMGHRTWDMGAHLIVGARL